MRARISLLLLAACAQPPPPRENVVVPLAVAPIPPPPPPPPAPPPPIGELREAPDPACRITADGWRSDGLRLRFDGPPFAKVDRVHATLVLPVTESPRESMAVIDDGYVLVRGIVTLANTILYPAKPIALLGILTPVPSTFLDWKGAARGSVRVGLDASSVLRSPQPFVADVRCDDVAIVEATYDARATITKKTGLPKRDVQSNGAPIAATPTSPPVGELNGGVQVELVETRGAQARILVEDFSYVVSGWVASKDLGPAGMHGTGGGGRGGGVRGQTIHRLYLLHCPTDVSLFAEIGGEQMKIGSVHKGTGFRPAADDKTRFRAIELPDSQWLVLEPKARLLVDTSELAACKQDSPGF